MNHYKLVQKALNDQADEAHHMDFIIKEIASRMNDRLDYIKLEPKRVLDIGSGLGIDYKLLSSKYPAANVYALDLTIDMLKQYNKNLKEQSIISKLFSKLQKNSKYNKLICANAISLPITSQSMDLVWSNLTLPYINIKDFKNYFVEINRVLKLGGTFLVSGLGVDSLEQLRQLGLSTYNFPDMHLIGDILVEVGFTNPVTDIDIIKLEYDNLSQLLADIKYIGGSRMLDKYLTKTTSKTIEDKYKELENNFWQMTDCNKFPLTLEVYYAHAWKDKIRKDLVSGRSIISFHPN
jgi:malonyl-CoA O-methyltransferase